MAAETRMDGKICLVTGATTGIGLETALALAEQGATVVAAGRSEAKCEALMDKMRARGAEDRVTTLLADLSVRDGVRALADAFKERHDRLDVLVNNAGAIFTDRQLTADGFEKTFALNHLAYFLLTHLLLDLLKASAPARIVSTSSGAHSGGWMHWDDLHMEKGYGRMGFEAYSQSKLANILFTRELGRQLEGTGVTATCLHPGFVRTGFAWNNGLLTKLVMPVASLFARTPVKGAETVIWLATSPEVEGESGGYYFDRKQRTPREQALSDEDAQRLWTISEELTGLSTP